MPVLSCGGMRYQFFRRDIPTWLVPRRRQAHVDEIVARALASGINHFETARDYGTSELQLGRSLRGFERDRIIVQTKVFPGPDSTKFEHTLERSLANLGLDYVDLLAIHGINTPELMHDTLRTGGCWDIARRFQRQGRIGYIGFSTHAPTPMIGELIDSDRFDFVNLHWYYINQSNWSAIDLAAKRDLGVFIISPSDKGGRLYKPPDKLRRLCAPLSPMLFNDLFCLSHTQVHTLSIGAARAGDFDEHLRVLPLLDKAQSILPDIVARLQAAAEQALGRDWLDTWNEGLPSAEQTPGQINIPVILWLRNLLLAYDMKDYAKMRYNLLGRGGHWFPGNGAGDVEKYDLGPCLAQSPHASSIPELLADTHRRLVGRPRRRLSQGWFVRGDE
jgi:hypothetical protein